MVDSSSDDELPLAPPEEEDDGRFEPLAPPLDELRPRRSGVGDFATLTPRTNMHTWGEPLLAPPEDGDPCSLLEHGVRVVEEVYANSFSEGTEVVMDAVRGLHPHWDQLYKETETGRWVTWVRTCNDWVYGELATPSFLNMVQYLSVQDHEVFVDLGCGTGRVTALASLVFRQALGLEIQEGLRQMALELAVDFQERTRAFAVKTGDICIHHADFLGALTPAWRSEDGVSSWWDVADVAYACSPKFCSATMHALSGLASRMRPGSRFVTVRRTLDSACFEEVWRGEATFSWGRDDMIIYRRVAPQ